jgi:hypothetical protein
VEERHQQLWTENDSPDSTVQHGGNVKEIRQEAGAIFQPRRGEELTLMWL